MPLPGPRTAWASGSSGARSAWTRRGGLGFSGLLALAALGGLLLNLTPCVLPVLPIKAMGLAAKADSRAEAAAAGGLTGLGIVGFWLALGGAIASLTGLSAVHSLFQRPAFTLGVGVMIAVMAAGMAGWFTVPLPRSVYAIDTAKGGWLGHVLLGVMTAVLSTPCTAPFMGSAAAWATTQPGGVTLAVFGAIGAGMALPVRAARGVPEGGGVGAAGGAGGGGGEAGDGAGDAGRRGVLRRGRAAGAGPRRAGRARRGS